MANRFEKTSESTPQGVSALYQHCEMLNSLRWVQASGKRYVVVEGPRPYIDLR